MKKIKCIIIDDEPLAIQLLENYVQKIDFLERTSAFDNPIKAIDFIQKNEVDLVFLDIQMPELSGINFMKILGEKAKYILTTAYSDYALEGYDYQVIDYLLKPISFERFLKSAEKARERLTSVGDNEKSFFFVKSSGQQHKINFSEINYIESIKDYVSINLNNQEFIVLDTLKSLETQLPDNFMRIHKSFILNINKIEKIDSKSIIINSGKEIPLGETFKSGFLSKLKNHPIT